MKSTMFFNDGAGGRSASIEQNQQLTERCGPESLIDRNKEISALPAPMDALLARAFGHSEAAARKARQIAVALQQWPNKTDAGKACERRYLLQDIDALSEMMGVRS